MATVSFTFTLGEDDHLIRRHNNADAMHEAIEAMATEIRAKMKHGDRETIVKWWPFAKLFKDSFSGVDWQDFPGLYTDDSPPE